MKAILDSPNADFLFARIHAQWARALTPAKILGLLSSSSTSALESALKAAGIPDPADPGATRRLTLRFAHDLSRLLTQLDPATGLFYACFIDRLYLDNLMLILRIRATPAHREEWAALILDAPELPPMHVEPLLQAASAAHMHALLPPSPFHRRLLPILREWDAGKDLFLAECRLDRLTQTTLMAAAKGLDDDLTESASRLAGAELDIAHILLLLRNLAVYHLAPEQLESLGYGNGRLIQHDAFCALARQTDTESLVSLLPEPYATGVRKAGPGNPAAVEDALRTLQAGLIITAFRDYSYPERTLIAYPFLRRQELRNTIRLVEGLRLKLPPGEIRDLIIGGAHV